MRTRNWALFLILTLAFSTLGWAQGDRVGMVLTPKAQLATEQGAWTTAPAVPPPIKRKEQKRVIVNWEIKEAKAEIAPGVIYDDYWAFEGKVPGPLLRVRVGDLVEVHLTNNITSMRSHNIDFHFVTGPGGGASALNVAPGETAVLEARAMAPGFYMFHCASPDIPTHIANGMYGFVIVEPSEGMAAVDHEYYVVQSEIYTQNGNKGHQTFSIERGEKADAQYVVFNGAVGSIMGPKALRAGLRDTVRIWVGNAGPNLVSSFHLIGQIFSNVYREGDLVSQPAHNIQTTLIPAGGSAVVEFSSAVPGTFLLVDHAIFRLHKGTAGSIMIDGPKNAEVFDPITAGASAMNMSDKDHVAGPPAETAHGSAQPAKTNSTEPPVRRVPAKAKPASLKPIALRGPITSINADYFPPPSEEELFGAVAQGNVTIRMLPGAGNYGVSPEQAFSTPKVTIKAGASVTFLNTDEQVHINKSEFGEFKTPMLKSGMAYTFKLAKPGVYHYQCIPHPWMKGTIVVR